MSPYSTGSMHLIAIAGLSCSGKSTLANLLAERFSAPVIALDDYYLPFTDLTLGERTKLNFDAPEMLDFPLLVQDLERLQSGESIEVPIYDFVEFTRGVETRRLGPSGVVILEGQYSLFSSSVNRLAQTRVFLDVDPMVCLRRRIQRDTVQRGRTKDEVQWRFMRHVMPMYERYVGPSQVQSNLVVKDADDPETAFGLVMRSLRSEQLV